MARHDAPPIFPLHSRSAATDGAMIDRERPSPSLVPQPVSAARRALRGIFLMVLASACIAGMHGLVRQMTAEIHPFVIAFFRNLTVPIVLAPWLLKAGWIGLRSEEHTSELQSLMRISYAVFCLKK